MLLKIGTPVMYIDDEVECDYPVGTIGIIKEVDYDSEYEDDWAVRVLFNGTEELTWHYLWEVKPVSTKISRTKEL